MRAAIPLFLITLVSCAAAAVGCGDDDESDNTTSVSPTTSSSSTGGGGSGGSGEAPTFPTLGAKIDRMGRPVINTALNHTFDADDTTKGEAKDAWNQADPRDWHSFMAEAADNLGVFDSIDADCGNQILAGPDPATADRYDDLATLFVDDRLWVRLNAATCTQYLGVELATPADDCGGRRLTDDVIAVSYSLLVAGDLTFSIDDTIEANEGKTSGETFPYLATPLQQ